ncbi:MAG: flagellar motor protein MotB [Caulobacterales bacterium 68-7]|nr:MAG: flagellar motor protein MotB [Caulobacterales bacterium 68-7]
MTKPTFRMAAVSGVVLLAGLAASGCATKNFVRDQVAVVDGRVGTVDQRVSSVDSHLGDVDAHVTRVEGTAGEALERAKAAGKLAEGKFMYEVVLSDDSVKFPLNASQLSPEAEQRLAELAQRLKGENKNVYLEIQGHTDASGNPAYNERLGEERAEAVRRFLSKQQIALNRMATVSYGEEEPVADNKTREGRAQNRRVAIVVLS